MAHRKLVVVPVTGAIPKVNDWVSSVSVANRSQRVISLFVSAVPGSMPAAMLALVATTPFLLQQTVKYSSQ